MPPEKATLQATAFWLRKEKDDKKVQIDEKEEEVLGVPLIKYGDTTMFIQHQETGLWLSYKVRSSIKTSVNASSKQNLEELLQSTKITFYPY